MASSALKLFLLLSAVFLSRASALNSSPSSTTSLQSQLSSVRSLCKVTPYPDVCFDTLKLSISVNISPNIIIYLLHTLQTALSESLKLSSTFSNVRYSNIIEKQRGTIQDCEELHQITLSALKRSASRMQEANHGKQAADAIRAYLSAALTNKNTCLEGLDSASGSFKPILVNSINNAYKHVSNCLSILPRKWPQTGRKNRRLMAVPKWMSRENSRVLESSDGEEYNPSLVLTVAADGTGNFTTITDAINYAPNNSFDDRTIIYVKEGIYAENVEIPSYKPNIVLLGDGSDVTFIVGSRSVDDGWTTFRSATLGKVNSIWSPIWSPLPSI